MSYAARSVLRLLVLLALPGCVVSFNDYPLGDLEGDAGKSSSGGQSAGGSIPLGGTQPKAGASALGGANGELLDDFEDGNQSIIPRSGRVGAWYVGNDGMGVQTPRTDQPVIPTMLDPARGDSRRAVHTSGGPFAIWGALLGTNLSEHSYDLSRYSGIRLWVRSGSSEEGAADSVRLNLPTPGTNSGAGICTVCSDHFGADIPLTSQWAQVTVPFSSIGQRGYGKPLLETPDLEHVTSLQLGFGKSVVFDLWVDDVELY